MPAVLEDKKMSATGGFPDIFKKILSVQIDYPVSAEELKERLHWLIRLRWAACTGILVGTHTIRELADLTFSLIPVYLVLGFVAIYNIYFQHRLKVRNDLRKDALLQICLDYITLTVAVYFSGGCDSPFLYYFVFHIVISGIILPRIWTFRFAAVAMALITTIGALVHFGVLPHFAIFRNEPILFGDISVMASYGVVLASTFFFTAYVVTYLSDKLYKKQEEVKRLYALSEKLRSSIVMDEVIRTIREELSLLTGISNIQYLSVDKNRVALVDKDDNGLSIPLSDDNAFTNTLLTCDAHFLSSVVIKSSYEDSVFRNIMNNAKEIAIFPVQTSLKDKCYDFFHCPEGSICTAYKSADRRCWNISDTYCRGEILRTASEKLKKCAGCDLFAPVGIFIVDITRSSELDSKFDLDACMRLLDSAILAVSNAKLYEKTLELSETDSLTEIKNRGSFLKSLSSEISRANRYNKPFGIMMMDLDLFKKYNDLNGHPQGDVLLKTIAGLIVDTMRETDVAGRYGGEEFIAMLPETTKEETSAIAERIRSAVECHKFPRAEEQPGGKITLSIGVSCYPEDGDNSEKIIQSADDALYTAKMVGRNRVIVANKPDGLM